MLIFALLTLAAVVGYIFWRIYADTTALGLPWQSTWWPLYREKQQ